MSDDEMLGDDTFIHGASSTPSTPGAVVAGGGTAAVNGSYPFTTTFGGKNQYNKAGIGDNVSAISWATFGGGETPSWNIWGPDTPVEPLYSSTEDVEFPWQVTIWTVGSAGSAPPPTVSSS